MAKLLRFDLRRGALRAAGLLVLVGLVAARFDYAPTDTPPINANQSAQQIHPRELRNRDGDPIAESPVVIVNIDRDSLDRVGPWPWNGDILAILLSNLYAYGVVSVGFDVIFETPGEDAVFASALRNSRSVLGQLALQSGPQVYLKPGANPAVQTQQWSVREGLAESNSFCRKYPRLTRVQETPRSSMPMHRAGEWLPFGQIRMEWFAGLRWRLLLAAKFTPA